MTSTRNVLISGLVAIMIAALFGTMALAVFGNRLTTPRHENTGAIMLGTAVAGTSASDSSAKSSAPGYGTLAAPAADGVANSMMMPYPGGGPFQPGAPPYGFNPGVAADGISAWGVAYQKTTDANAKVGADLVKAAYQDAQSNARTLATATGLSVGKVLAINDLTMNQPYYNACIQPQMGVPEKPNTDPGTAPGATGSGSSGSGTTTIAPAPGKPILQPAPCNQDHYLVAWVMVRFAIA
jgi:hypothetical protein